MQKETPVHIEVLLDPALCDTLIDELTVAFIPHTPRGRVTLDVLTPSKKFTLAKTVEALVVVLAKPEVERAEMPLALELSCAAQERGLPVVVVCSDETALHTSLAAAFGIEVLDTVVSQKTTDILNQLASWFAQTMGDVKIALATNFDWMRAYVAKEAVISTAMQNGAIGFVFFIPGSDLPVMTLNQVKMVLQIAFAYGQSLTKDRVKELAVVVGGGFLFRSLARGVVGAIPFLGWIVKGVVGFSGTLAMGYGAIEYFEDGGTIEGLSHKLQTLRDGLVRREYQLHRGRDRKVTGGHYKLT